MEMVTPRYTMQLRKAILGLHAFLLTNVQARDAQLRTPLHNAVERGCEEVVQLILAKGSDANFFDYDGQTALHCAAS